MFWCYRSMWVSSTGCLDVPDPLPDDCVYTASEAERPFASAPPLRVCAFGHISTPLFFSCRARFLAVHSGLSADSLRVRFQFFCSPRLPCQVSCLHRVYAASETCTPWCISFTACQILIFMQSTFTLLINNIMSCMHELRVRQFLWSLA
jgi:hypothetical protein